MPLPAENETLLCEQCGAPLQSRAGQEDCLNCLLSAGIEAEAEMADPPEESGTRFYQHYEILLRPDGSRWELGRGAMGVTYKARDMNLNTLVALKVISVRFSARPDARRRFLQEAQAAARLRHSNVASVFHFGTINSLPVPERAWATAEENADAGDCFYAMEFVAGETLEARLRRSGPLTPLQAVEIALQVTRALRAAEKCGFVHRDLKPSNIMLAGEEPGGAVSRGQSGESWVKVIDFGLAQMEARGEPPAVGRFFGTPAFASPEQIEGRPIDGRSDIYSLGATIWYALTRKPPYTRDSSSDPGKVASNALLPVAELINREIPPQMISLLESMLAYAPEDRPGSAVELAQALQRCLVTLTRGAEPTAQTRKWTLVGAGLGMAAALAGLFFYLASPKSMEDKSIAVLPFRNLSQDPANAFFAEGVQDDLLSRLVKVRDLKVISRLGTSFYPADKPRDFRAIGRALGVRHVLEGSLLRSGNRVLVHVALVDTRNGNKLWAESYDRNLADAINLQGELASSIADALNATLSPQESRGLRAKPTHSPDAYVLYLRARKFDNSPTFAVSDNEAAQALYSQAIALDPGFALAHARRGATLGFLYRFRAPSEQLRNTAYAEVREALRLSPDLGEAHLASALCAYRIDRDFDRALPELKIAQRLLPNDTEAESFIAYIHRRRGQWKEARTALEHCLTRDPRNVTYHEELYTTGYLLRDWSFAAEHIQRAVAFAPPSYVLLKVEAALVDVWQSGNLVPLQKVLANIPGYGDPEGNLAWMRWDAAMLARDFVAAQDAIDGFPFETLPSVYSAPVPKSYLEGCIALAQGERQKAQEFFESARPSMEAETISSPDSSLRHERLGMLYAYMGRKADAIKEGERAVALTPVSEDSYDGSERLCSLALIHARIGDTDQAINMIQSLLQKPAGVFFYEASMSWSELRLRWQWDPLRSDPRFQKIVSEPEPPTIY